MFHLFVCINLILVYASCQTTEDAPIFTVHFDTSQSRQQDTTEQPIFESTADTNWTQTWQGNATEQPVLESTADANWTQTWQGNATEQPIFESTADTNWTQTWQGNATEQPVLESTADTNWTQTWQGNATEQPMLESTADTNWTQTWQQDTTEESNTSSDSTQSWEESTTEETSVNDNFTTVTIQGTTCTPPPTTATMATTCAPSITPDMLEEAKREIINSVLLAISREIADKLDVIAERLSKLTCSNDQTSSPIELAWRIYENLQIPLKGWLRVFDHPYSHKTRSDDLNQIAGICHKDILVAATFNKTISLAAVGPASVLTMNTTWNQPQQFGQVYWYRSIGRSFGFSPLATIRQTSGDNEDLDSSLRLSWLLDQNVGGYRAGATRYLADNSLWHKVIYCN